MCYMQHYISTLEDDQACHCASDCPFRKLLKLNQSFEFWGSRNTGSALHLVMLERNGKQIETNTQETICQINKTYIYIHILNIRYIYTKLNI
jgi:hypothetical protein